jgi:DNA repair exonuclease SbcCD nuclease subunit
LLHPLGTVPLVVRFLHTADLQLGMSRRFLTPEAQARFSHARVEVVRALGRLAEAEGCEFVLVSGDVFESNHIDRQVLVRALAALGEVPVPVYLLPGNHDPLDAATLYRGDLPPNVTVLGTPGVHAVRPGVELVAAPWTSKRPLEDLVDAACAGLTPAEGLRIAVGHGALDALSPDRDNPALISLDRLEQRLAQGVLHYVALGDRHSTTSVGTSGRVWYSGAPEATDFDELDPGNVLVVELSAHAAAVAPRRLGRWRFARQAWDVSGVDDVDALAAWLAGLADKPETIVRVHLTGTVSLGGHARLHEVLDDAAPSFAALDVWGDVLALPDDGDLSALALTGFAAKALGELEDSEDEDDRAALSLLYRLARGAA